ncbi:unnamed protein product [Prunus armeniaca]
MESRLDEQPPLREKDDCVEERECWLCANLAAWCSGLRGCASTRDVLLLDAVRLCTGVPVRSTVCRDDDEVRVEDG